MKLTARVFEAAGVYKLLPFEVMEGDDVSIPEGAVQLHSEPIVTEDGAIEGFDLWLLVPSNRMAESVHQVGNDD